MILQCPECGHEMLLTITLLSESFKCHNCNYKLDAKENPEYEKNRLNEDRQDIPFMRQINRLCGFD